MFPWNCTRVVFEMYSCDAVILQDSERSPCKRTRLITASLLQLLLESVNGALVALLKILSRCHGDPTSYLLRFYQNAEDEPSNGVLSDPSATIQDVAALLRRCWRMCGAQLVGLDF